MSIIESKVMECRVERCSEEVLAGGEVSGGGGGGEEGVGGADGGEGANGQVAQGMIFFLAGHLDAVAKRRFRYFTDRGKRWMALDSEREMQVCMGYI